MSRKKGPLQLTLRGIIMSDVSSKEMLEVQDLALKVVELVHHLDVKSIAVLCSLVIGVLVPKAAIKPFMAGLTQAVDLAISYVDTSIKIRELGEKK